MSNWITTNEFRYNMNVKVECSKHTQVQKCAVPDCGTLLVYDASGTGEDDEEFRAKSCTCGETEYYTLCCSVHKDTFVCSQCAEAKKKEDSEEEGEEESASKRARNE